MKPRTQMSSIKWYLWGILSVLCLLFAGGILLAEQSMQKKLYDQQMAKRWGKDGNVAQVSAFFAEGEVDDVSYFRGIEATIENALLQASVTSQKENARLWIQAVSRNGKVTLGTTKSKVELEAVGVSGEFFMFHPQTMVTGSLFREDSMMSDGVVIDKETAWQLFGSGDVAGMQVMIGQVPHYITGVIERPRGRLYEAAGLNKSVCYLSIESLQEYGTATGGFTYEVVMPNPIQNFALSAVKNAIGTENEAVVLIENSSRFTFLSILEVIKQFGIRSMSFKDIVYPYWENVARGYEDIYAVLLLLKMILLFIPLAFFMVVMILLWKRKKWTTKDTYNRIKDILYDVSVKQGQKKKTHSTDRGKRKSDRTKETKKKQEENYEES